MFTYKDIQLFSNLTRYKLFGHRFPAHVVISATNKCNLKCPYCFAKYVTQQKDRINTQKMISLIDEVHIRGARLINLSGGEPLIRPDIKEIIEYITRNKGMKCSVSTNGLLIKKKISALEDVTSINVSLDGNEEQHNSNRNAKVYKKVISGIEVAVANRIPVTTCTVLTEKNKNCIGYIADLAKKKGFSCVFHLLRVGLKPDKELLSEQLGLNDTSKIIQQIIDYKNAGYPIHYSNKTHTYIRDWPYEHPSRLLRKGDGQSRKPYKIIPCVCGDLSCFIDGEGRIFPCAVLSGQVNTPNVLELGFQKAWDFLPNIRCEACPYFFQTELNLLLSLNPSTWIDFIKTSKLFR